MNPWPHGNDFSFQKLTPLPTQTRGRQSVFGGAKPRFAPKTFFLRGCPFGGSAVSLGGPLLVTPPGFLLTPQLFIRLPCPPRRKDSPHQKGTHLNKRGVYYSEASIISRKD